MIRSTSVFDATRALRFCLMAVFGTPHGAKKVSVSENLLVCAALPVIGPLWCQSVAEPDFSNSITDLVRPFLQRRIVPLGPKNSAEGSESKLCGMLSLFHHRNLQRKFPLRRHPTMCRWHTGCRSKRPYRRAACFDRLANASSLVCRKVVDHDDILALEGRSQTPFDVSQELFPVIEPSRVHVRYPERAYYLLPRHHVVSLSDGLSSASAGIFHSSCSFSACSIVRERLRRMISEALDREPKSRARSA